VLVLVLMILRALGRVDLVDNTDQAREGDGIREALIDNPWPGSAIVARVTRSVEPGA
jgi:hypothetical protein